MTWLIGVLTSVLCSAPQVAAQASDDLDAQLSFERALQFRHIGPIGNRVPAVVGVAGDPLTYFAGAASGGVFRSRDGGVSWQPVFDDQPAASIGSLAVAPSDPNVIWVGTGETFIRSNISIGNGVYRSVDAGDGFEHLGLERSGRIGRIVVHPRDPDIAWVAALGHAYGPQEERGVFKTDDGGKSWRHVLKAGPHAGAIDLALAPDNPRTLYAATWQIEIKTWGRFSGGDGSGLWRSSDSGETFERLASPGLPKGPLGKIGLAVSADRPDRLYALIETNSNRNYCDTGPLSDDSPPPCDQELEQNIESTLGQGVLWRSEDRGDSFERISADHALTQRPLYYTRAVAAPDNANEITFMAVQQSLSIDGGKTTSVQNSGWDHHDLWIDPENTDRRIAGHDGGVSITLNRGETWFKPQLPIAQMYHVATDDRIPYFVYGNRQDGPSMRGPSRTLTGEQEIASSRWHSVGGCEVGFALPVPESDTVWSGCYDGMLDLHDLSTGHSRNVSVWPIAVESWPAEELDYRIQWTAPLGISPHDPGTVYYGSQFVHKTVDEGQTWEIISPDLTTDNPHLQKRWGGLTLDDAGPTIAPVIFALAESPLERGAVWAGTNDGQLQLSRDGGETWSNLTDRLPGLPPFGTISNIEPSRHLAGRAYVTVDRHQLGDPEPYVLRTDDWGATWQRIDTDLPRDVFGYAHCVREDPEVADLLFLGTENALWVSFDGGNDWHSLRSNLPHAPVHWLTIQERFSDLVIATYGRGFFILDDITSLRHLATRDRGLSEIELIPPRSAYRFRQTAQAVSQVGDPAIGHNPTYGAPLNYFVPTEHGAALEVRIYDDQGELVRTLDELGTEVGLHRVYWDLRGESSTEVMLENAPLEEPLLELPKGETRPLRDGGTLSVLKPPGRYRIDLVSINNQGKDLEADQAPATESILGSVNLWIEKDPNSKGDPSQIEQQSRILEDLWRQADQAAKNINALESTRSDLKILEQRLTEHLEDQETEEISALLEQVKRARDSARQKEGRYFDLRMTQGGQDTLRWKRLHYARLSYLARAIGATDFRPTAAQQAVFESLSEDSRSLARELEELRQELSDLDRRLRESTLPAIVLPNE